MKKKIVWIGILLAAVSVIGLSIKMGSQAIVVELAKVTKGDIEEYIEETGDLMLEEEITVYSVSSGKVIQAAKKTGETVKAGELLAKIDNTDLLLQIKALEAQKLAIAAKYAEIQTLTNDEAVSLLNSQVRSAEALYEEMKRTVNNNKVLYEAGAISLDTYNSSVTKLAAAEASLETAKNNLTLAEKGTSENVKKQYEAQLSEIKYRIEQLKLKSEDMIIKAPIDGVVMNAEVKEGSIVQAGSKLYDIGGYKGYYIESDILIDDISEVKVGSPVIIDDEDIGIRNMKGSVRKIHPKAQSIISDLGIEQKRVKVEIKLNNTVEGLRPGYDMTVKIIKQSKKDTLLIPEKAIFNYQDKDYVFVNEDGVAKLRAIEKGLESSELVEVLKGLNDGEEVILSPDETLEEGTKIKIKEAY